LCANFREKFPCLFSVAWALLGSAYNHFTYAEIKTSTQACPE
jgi:hypothetical protein